MKKMETVLTQRGQTSIPAQVRRQMHLLPGAKIRWQTVSDTECRMIVSDSEPQAGAQAMRGYARKYRKPMTTDEWMRELRDGEC